MNDLDRGALLAIDLLMRGVLVTEDETSPEEHAEGIRAAVKEGGIALAIRREMDFERSLNIPGEFNVTQTYGRFPRGLAAFAAPLEDPR